MALHGHAEGDGYVPGSDETHIIQIVTAYRKEARDAKRIWEQKTRANWNAYHGRRSWRHKVRGQSKETIPKVPMATEQISGYIKTGLVEFGDWFDVELANDYILESIDASATRRLVKDRLEGLDFATLIADGVKVGLMEALIIYKVYMIDKKKRVPEVEYGLRVNELGESEMTQNMVMRETVVPELAIDLVRAWDYYPDPSGRGLYKIHRVERDIHEVIAMAEAGVYKYEVIEQIQTNFQKAEDKVARAATTESPIGESTPKERKTVTIDEVWATILDERGRVQNGMENIVCAVANEQYLIRDPEPNRFWHGEDPFVEAPIVRVPHSVWHKAFMDHVTPLARAHDELFNLILDGAIKSVWGVSQIRLADLENPSQVSGGIGPGTTLAIKQSVPDTREAFKRVDTGNVPQEAMAITNLIDREIQAASLVSETKLGLLPPRQVKATEIIEISQQSTAFFNSIIRDLEDKLIEPLLDKIWKTMWQFMPDMYQPEIVAAIGEKAAITLAQLSPEERYIAVANAPRFRVRGLRAITRRQKDFDKMATFMEIVFSNEFIAKEFFAEFSLRKFLSRAMKLLSIDPETLRPDEQELHEREVEQAKQEEVEKAMLVAQAMGGLNGPQGQGQR